MHGGLWEKNKGIMVRSRRAEKLTLSNVGVLVAITELKSLVDTGGGTRRDISAENT